MSLSVAPTRLKELLNTVYRKGQSWDLYSSASILMIYLCIYHHILQNVICSRMTPHFIQQEKALCKFKQRYSFVLIVFQWGTTLITLFLLPGSSYLNQLPVSVRHSTSVSSFKSSLKTFLFLKTFPSDLLSWLPWYATGVCVGGGGGGTRARACVCESVCVRACVCAFMLYALNFDNMYL